jgi:translocation and assembly module TamB
VWRRLVILLAVLAAALAGGAVALKSERVASYLRHRLEQLAADDLGIRLAIGSLRIELMPPRLRFEDVKAWAAGVEAPVLELRAGAAAVFPWPSATGALVIDELELDGLRTSIDVRHLTAPKRSTRRELRSPVDVRHLRVTDAEVHVDAPGFTLDLSKAAAGVRPTANGRRELSLDVESGFLVREGRSSALSARLRASLTGGLDRPELVELHACQGTWEDTVIGAAGSITLGASPALDLDLSAAGPLARLHELVPDAPPLGGALQATVHLRGEPIAPAISLRVRVTDLKLWGTNVGDAEAEGRLEPDRLRVDSFSLTHPRGGKLTGSGTLELGAGFPTTLAVRLHEVSLPVVLELAGLPGAWVDAHVSGDTSVRGRLSPFALHAEVTAVVEDFRALDRSFEADGPVAYLDLGPVGAQGRITIGTTAVTLEDVTLARGGSRARVQGSLFYDPTQGLELHTTSDDFGFDELGPVAGVRFNGRGAFGGAVEGPYDDPTISATLTAADLSVLGYYVGDVRGTLVYGQKLLRLERAAGRRGGGSFTASGHIDFHDSQLVSEGTADLQGVSFDNVLVSVGMPGELRRRLGGRVDGHLHVEGPMLAPEASCTLTGPALTIDGAELGLMTLEARYSGLAGRGTLHLEAGGSSGSVQADALADSAGQLVVDASLRELSLATFASLLGGIDIAGHSTGTIHLEGQSSALGGRVELTSPDLVTYATRLGFTHLVGDVADGVMSVSGTSSDGHGDLRAEVKLDRRLPYSLAARFADVKLGSLWPGVSWLDVSAGGSLSSKGLLTDATTMTAEIVLDSGRGNVAGVAMTLARPSTLVYADGALRSTELAIGGPGVSATLSGSLGVDASISVDVGGALELEAARPTLSRLSGSRGHLDLRLAVGGTWAVPTLVGSATLRDGLLRLQDSGQTIDGASGRVVFSGRNISVERVAGRIGGGGVSLAGQIALPPGKDPVFDLHAQIDEVSLRPSAQLNFSVAGDLRLLGERRNLQLSGDLELQSLRYNANLDLERLVPRRNAPPLRVPALDPGNAVRLSVRVNAPDNVVVTSPVLEAEFHADLVITGTTERLGLVGSLTPLWARARYLENVFEVEHASILFTDEYRVFTQFDLRARTQACNMQIAVAIQGDSDSYNVVPSGVDEVGPVSAQDVLACLQLGLRLRDLQGTGGTTLLSDRLTSSSLDALWTVSGLDQQVRRILPIVDEFRVSSGWSQRNRRSTTRIVVGKELGQNLQLTFSRALDVEYDQILSVAYKMSDLATMLGTWNTGTDAQGGDFGLDLRLRWEFQ